MKELVESLATASYLFRKYFKDVGREFDEFRVSTIFASCVVGE